MEVLRIAVTLSGGCQETETEEGDRGSHRTWSGGDDGTENPPISTCNMVITKGQCPEMVWEFFGVNAKF